LPAVRVWVVIASRVASAAERAARGRQTIDQALGSLDAEVDAILEKRRWLLGGRQ
jgi:multiple sugar transport system substrate-binding protein